MDFENCVARKDRISRVKNSLNDLREEVLDIATQDIAPFLKTNFAPSIWDQGRLRYKDSMWIGFAHRRFKNARYTVQFQFGIDSERIWSNGIWLDKNADPVIRGEAIRRLKSQERRFLRILKALPHGYYIEIRGSPRFKEPVPTERLDLRLVNQLLEAIRSGVHFSVALEMSKDTALNLGEDLAAYLLRNFMRLLPLYSLMTGIEGASIGEVPDVPMPVETQQDLLDAVQRRLRSLKIASTKPSERNAVKEYRRLVTYERNWEAQERASKGHRRIVTLLISEIQRHDIIPKDSDVDLLASTRGTVFIFEAKTIHVGNYLRQTRSAIGQLLDYEYFHVRRRPDFRGKHMMRGVVYGNRPPRDIIDFLRTYDFKVYWLENNKLTGEDTSLRAFRKFLRRA
jgi:hypothetical protein